MPMWAVKTNGDPDDEPLFVVEANADGTCSLHMPSPDPVVVTTRKLEEIRFAVGAAISIANAEPQPSQEDV